MTSADLRLTWPAPERNKDAILTQLLAFAAEDAPARVLEIASGSGQHVAHFARAMPTVDWQPSDREGPHRASIDAWTSALPHVRPAIAIDVTAPWWEPLAPVDWIYCANMIHIAPIAAAEGLMRGAQALLRPPSPTRAGGSLILYGPFFFDDVQDAPSNLAFDASLRSRDPRWGIRHLDQVQALASPLTLTSRHAMPANNFVLRFQRT